MANTIVVICWAYELGPYHNMIKNVRKMSVSSIVSSKRPIDLAQYQSHLIATLNAQVEKTILNKKVFKSKLLKCWIAKLIASLRPYLMIPWFKSQNTVTQKILSKGYIANDLNRRECHLWFSLKAIVWVKSYSAKSPDSALLVQPTWDE